MSFLYPAFLLGGLAIALPIVLHLLRRDVAPEVPFTAVRLLHRSPVERADRRRLRDLLLLAARVAALLLLAAAFARPYVQGAGPAPLRVVAIDRSFSMGAPGLFARALTLARAAIDEAAAGERIAVVAFDDRADVVATPGGAADARAALATLAPGFGATRYAPVLQQVADLAAGASGRLVVVSDLQRAGWEGESASTLPAGWSLDVRDVTTNQGTSARNNVAVSAVTVEAAQVVATIRNSGDSARAGRVRLLLDGREVASAAYAVAAGASAETPVVWRAPESGTLSVAVDDPEGVPADDVRFVALGTRRAPKALIVGGGSGAEAVAVAAGKPGALYLSRALATSSGEAVDVVPGSRVAALSRRTGVQPSRGGAALDPRPRTDRP